MRGFLTRSDATTASVAVEIRDAAARDLFALVGGPVPPRDRALDGVARRMLREHVGRVADGDIDSRSGAPDPFWNISCLGTLDEIESQLANGELHAWGHFLIAPRAHAEAVAAFTSADGTTRVYMATAWRA